MLDDVAFMWAKQPIRWLLQTLYGMLHELCGLFHPQNGIHECYVGFFSLYGTLTDAMWDVTVFVQIEAVTNSMWAVKTSRWDVTAPTRASTTSNLNPNMRGQR